MRIKGAIFDVDGTLLDTMPVWTDSGARYLKTLGIEAEPGLGDILFTMTVEMGAEYLKENYRLPQPVPEIRKGINSMVEQYYFDEADFKPGARRLLDKMKAAGIPMSIATSTDRYCIRAAFDRLGYTDCFEAILTCTEVGASKSEPKIFYEAARAMGTPPEETWLFEDGLYSMRTAKKEGFKIVGVYDAVSEADQDDIRTLSDIYVKNLGQLSLKQEERKGWVLSADQPVCRKKTALTIAGSDCSGGAGIQADLKTMTVNGVYAMSAVTALTAQNTTGVSGIMEVTPEFLAQQLDSIFTDIRPDAVKIGMVSSSALIETIADKLQEYRAENIVLDTVMVATSGAKLISDDAIGTLCSRLMPLAAVITPNIPEAQVLAGMEIRDKADMEKAAAVIFDRYGCCVLCKGGHSVSDADDLLFDGKSFRWLRGKRIDNPNTHGTGCTLSSAIAANLAKGMELEKAVEAAKDYISGALSAMLDLGSGSGPLDHGFCIK